MVHNQGPGFLEGSGLCTTGVLDCSFDITLHAAGGQIRDQIGFLIVDLIDLTHSNKGFFGYPQRTGQENTLRDHDHLCGPITNISASPWARTCYNLFPTQNTPVEVGIQYEVSGTLRVRMS